MHQRQREIRYGAVGTPKKFWSVWAKGDNDDANASAVLRIANQVPAFAVRNKLFTSIEEREAMVLADARRYFEELWAEGERLPTAQDRTLWV